MPSSWFRGGLDYTNDNNTPWDTAAGLRCSAVAGTSIVTSSKSWQTLDDFLQSNSLVGDEADVPTAPNRGTTWVGGTNSYEFWFNDPLSFGVIANGQNVAGIVFYSGTKASPAAATLWLCSENAGGFFTGDGGIASVGTSGQNIVGRWSCLDQLNRVSFQGALDQYVTRADTWGDGTWRVGYALVSAASTAGPSRSWRLMSDVPAGVIYCQGAGPGDTNQPETQLVGRDGPAVALITDGDYYEWGIKSTGFGRVPITWPNGGLQEGETITAVIAFMYQGVYNAATAWVLHWDDVANHTILVAQDVTYGGANAFALTQGLIQ